MRKHHFLFQLIKGKVKAGKVDCQAYGHTCQKANIKAYPTVKLYLYDRAKVCTRLSAPSLRKRRLFFIYCSWLKNNFDIIGNS